MSADSRRSGSIRSTIARVLQQEDINFLLTNRIPRRLATRFMGWFSRIEQPLVRDLSIAVWRFFSEWLSFGDEVYGGRVDAIGGRRGRREGRFGSDRPRKRSRMSPRRSMTNHDQVRRSALFMLGALGAEVVSLAWRHPLSVYVFGVTGSLLVLFSIASLLLSLVSRPAESEHPEPVESDDEQRRVAAG